MLYLLRYIESVEADNSQDIGHGFLILRTNGDGVSVPDKPCW